MDCQICCEKFTKTTRKEIKCPSPDCEGSWCLKCFKRYLSEDGDIIPKCMFCSKQLSYNFVRENVPKAWANKDYMDVRTNHLLAREKSLLPDSQPEVKKELDRRKCSKKCMTIDEQIVELERQIFKLNEKKRDIWQEHYDKFRIQKKEKNVIVTRRRCPVDDCEGFLENNWKCGICEVKCCSDCGEVKGENHACNEETKATFQLLKTDTRPCPDCGILIHKWQGCNQMYCTQCHCMFDYRTGRLENGFFHNPHYFDAIDNGIITRQHQNRNAEGQCGLPNVYTFMRKARYLKNRFPKAVNDLTKTTDLLRMVNHITDVTFNRRYRDEDIDSECETMRRDFLLKDITEEDWVKRLRVLEKRRERNSEIRDILNMFVQTSTDILMNINHSMEEIPDGYDRLPSPTTLSVNINGELVHVTDVIKNQLEQQDKIRHFCNIKWDKMETLFNNRMPYIDENYSFFGSRGI